MICILLPEETKSPKAHMRKKCLVGSEFVTYSIQNPCSRPGSTPGRTIIVGVVVPACTYPATFNDFSLGILYNPLPSSSDRSGSTQPFPDFGRYSSQVHPGPGSLSFLLFQNVMYIRSGNSTANLFLLGSPPLSLSLSLPPDLPAPQSFGSTLPTFLSFLVSLVKRRRKGRVYKHPVKT